MSVAFTKEGDTENAAALDLPDRPISPHPNLVTAAGLTQLEAAVAQARAEFAANQMTEDRGGDRRALARAARDLRYFTVRLATAQLMPLPAVAEVVRFGVQVTIERADGRRQTLRLVGEDEADPKAGTVSYASPLASALMGKGVGDTVLVAGGEIEIIEIG